MPVSLPQVQTFDASEIDSIYTELGGLVVPLDEDPLSFGPKRLNLKVSLVRRALDRVEKLFLDISHRLQLARRSLRIAKLDFELAKKHLFASDPETRAGRSVSDREAIAAGKLRKEVNLLNDLEILVGDLEAVLDVIKAKRADLKGTEARLKDQLQLCREEISLGHRWGSKVPDASVDYRNGRAATEELQHVGELIEGVEGEIHLASSSGDWSGPADDEETSEEKTEEAIPETVTATEIPQPETVEETPTAEKGAVIESLPENGDPGKVPETTTSTQAVDDFLMALPMEGLAAPPPEKGDGHVALVDDSLLDFLADFESNE